MPHFITEAEASGTDRISLATLEGPAGAGQFYERLGWQFEIRHQTVDGRWILLYNLRLSCE